MSRSGYTDDCDESWQFVMWHGQVKNALRGKRGQKFLRDLIDGLDALPEKVLIAGRLQEPETGCVCAIGAVGLKRGVALEPLETFAEQGGGHELGRAFDVARQLALEVEYINDEAAFYPETPEARWTRVRKWAVSNLIGDA